MLQLADKFFFIFYKQVKKYQTEERSKEIASFLVSIYLTIVFLIIYFLFRDVIRIPLLDRVSNKYVAIGIPILNYFICLLYFSYHKKYEKIDAKFSVTDRKKIKNLLLAFSICVFVVLILVAVLAKLI